MFLSFHSWSSSARSPHADDGLETSGDGGGTVVSSCCTTFSERWLRGFDAASLKALWMSSVEKESLRGSWWEVVGRGMVEVIFVVGLLFGLRSGWSWGI